MNYPHAWRGILACLVAAIAWVPVAAQSNSPIVDPLGDAVGAFGSGGELLDIDTVTVETDGASLFITVTFHTLVAAPSAMVPNSVVGVIELDIDRDPSTGATPVQNQFSPPFALLNFGSEIFVDLNSESTNPGQVNVFNPTNPGGTAIGTYDINYTDDSFSLTIPLADLGTGLDGIFDFSVIIGTVAEPTDALEAVGTSIQQVGGQLFVRGDCRPDGIFDLLDGLDTAFFTNGLLAEDPTCLAACDANGDGDVNIDDAMFNLNYTFIGGPPPPAPFPGCASVGPVDCAEYNACF